MTDTEHTKELLNNCIEYLAELWERLPNDEWNDQWKNIIGLTDAEMTELDLLREE